MLKINENYLKLPGSYLFSEIARRVAAAEAENPEMEIIKLGIGDVTLPLAPAVTEAMAEAVREMGGASTFRGYGPEQGYAFLREAISEYDYKRLGAKIEPDEIFISDGAKSDCGNIGDIFDTDNTVAVCDPVYPVYVDTNAMAGRAGDCGPDGRWSKLVYMPCVGENGFIPKIPKAPADIYYLCFPNNPTGSAATKEQLKQWVNHANDTGAIILYDSAYEAYISEPDIPHSVFEIEGAKTCAIEFRSFSKTAGFTGTRCAYTVVPHELKRRGVELHALWNRRQATKFNGVSYIVQRGAAAVYTKAGRAQVTENIAYYMKNAETIRGSLKNVGLEVFGGVNAPYIWVKTPMDSWSSFDRLLRETGVVTTPGAGFGPCGEGYIRLTAFGETAKTAEACERIVGLLSR